MAQIRAAVVARIVAAEPGEAGAVAAALLVGERSGLSEATKESLRISGLAHILAISGLHMMLIAGTAFFVDPGAAGAVAAAGARLPDPQVGGGRGACRRQPLSPLSGGGAATVRAYVMAAIMFSAILLDRPAISMRNLAIAAFVVVALQPESVMEPGFQMSFGAVAALIAAWEYWRDRQVRRLVDDDALPGYRIVADRRADRPRRRASRRSSPGLATAPFAAYHFERVASYSLLGNLLAAPLVSRHHHAVRPAGARRDAVRARGAAARRDGAGASRCCLAVAAWVASLPGAEVRAPDIAPLSLLLIVAGMLWLCLWRLSWRLLGLPAIALGLISIPFLIDPPDILVAPDGKAVAVRDPGGVLRVSGARAGSYVVEQFFDEEGPPPEDGAALKAGVRCDKLACILGAKDGVEVSHVLDPAAFAEDCRRESVIVTPLRAPADCAAPLVIDAERLARDRRGGRADRRRGRKARRSA